MSQLFDESGNSNGNSIHINEHEEASFIVDENADVLNNSSPQPSENPQWATTSDHGHGESKSSQEVDLCLKNSTKLQSTSQHLSQISILSTQDTGSNSDKDEDFPFLQQPRNYLSDEEFDIRKRLLTDILTLPLAESTRPKDLHEYVGQEHLIKEGPLGSFIKLRYLPSMILYGPPGVGKTTIASIVAENAGYVFVGLSATDATVSDLRNIQELIQGENARRSRLDVDNLKVAVFIDEIHRFTKVHQDYLLQFVESGVFTFIGATTINPYSRLRPAVLSRCQIFQLVTLSKLQITTVLRRALIYENIKRRVLYRLGPFGLSNEELEYLAEESHGDSRQAVNMIELLSNYFSSPQYQEVSRESLSEAISVVKRHQFGINDAKNVPLVLDLFDSLMEIHNDRYRKHLLTKLPRNLFEVLGHPEPGQVERATKRLAQFLYSQDRLSSKGSTQFRDSPFVTIHAPSSDQFMVTIRVASNVSAQTPKISGASSEAMEGYLADSSDFSDWYNSDSELSLQDDDYFLEDFKLENFEDLDKDSEYFKHMQLSDDSDVEDIMEGSSDSSTEVYDIDSINQKEYFTVKGMMQVLLLLNLGESPYFLGKMLLMFTILYIDIDGSYLRRALSMLKSLKISNSDQTMVLSNYVQMLVRAEKKEITPFNDLVKQLRILRSFWQANDSGVNESKDVSSISAILSNFKVTFDYNEDLEDSRSDKVYDSRSDNDIGPCYVEKLSEVESLLEVDSDFDYFKLESSPIQLPKTEKL